MSLSEHINKLLDNLNKIEAVPFYKNILFIERENIIFNKRVTFKQSNLISYDDYNEKFFRLLRQGFSWINFSCYGLLNDMLIIGIEYPDKINQVPIGKTTINYQGPPIDYKTNKLIWDIKASFNIIED